MKQIETVTPLLLKIALIVLAIPALFAFFFIGYNVIAAFAKGTAPWFIYPPFILTMLACIPYLYALKPAFLLVINIEHEQFFTEASLINLNQIMIAAGIIGIVFLIEMPFWFLIAQWDDAPGLILIMGFIMGLAFTVSLFAILLKRVIKPVLK